MSESLKGGAVILLRPILLLAPLSALRRTRGRGDGEQAGRLVGALTGGAGGRSCVADSALQRGDAISQRRQHGIESGDAAIRLPRPTLPRLRGRRLRGRRPGISLGLGGALDNFIGHGRGAGHIALWPIAAV